MIGSRRGRVATWNDPAGYGTVADDEGGEWFVHCTAIADGSRAIEVGTEVDFTLSAGHRGALEARDVRPRERVPSSRSNPGS